MQYAVGMLLAGCLAGRKIHLGTIAVGHDGLMAGPQGLKPKSVSTSLDVNILVHTVPILWPYTGPISPTVLPDEITTC